MPGIQPLAMRPETAQRLSVPPTLRPVPMWWLCDLLTGQILAELPITADALSTQIAVENTATLTLPVHDPRCPSDWCNLLTPGKTMLVLTLDDIPTEAWAVIEAPVGDLTVPVNVTTLETCLARTNIPDLTASLDEAGQAAALCVPVVEGFGFTTFYTLTGQVSDAAYDASVDQSVLAALQELMAREGGPEFMVAVAWNAAKTGFDKQIVIAPKVGTVRPDVIFDLDASGRGNIVSYKRTRSYAAGDGATVVTGVLDGGGSSRVMTDPVVSPLVAKGWPRWEERKSFTVDADSTEDEDSQLARLTRNVAAVRAEGATSWTFVTDPAGGAPAPGRDFGLGDTVQIEVAPQGASDPVGGSGSVRVAGWSMSWPSLQVTPTVWADPNQGEG